MKEIKTWYDLKTFCNTLKGEQLGQEIKVWGEEFAKKINGVEIFSFDMINPSGEGVEPTSVYLDEPELIENETVIYKKGDIMLSAENI